MDQAGFFYLIDRKKDMIIVSGLKVYPSEVEKILLLHPIVQEAAVVGTPDPQKGERVHAFIVSKEPTIKAKEIRNYCKSHLSPYKVPREIHFVQELPYTPVGKILKRVLKEQLLAP